MSDQVASLGFEVDSKPLDDAKQKLADVASQADKTGQSVEKFNQQANKTGAAMKQAGGDAASAAGSFKSITSAVDQSGQAVQKAAGFWKSFGDAFKAGFNDAVNQSKNYSSEIAKAGSVTQQIEQIVAKSGLSFGDAAKQIAGATAAHAAHREASVASAAAQGGLGSAIGAVSAASRAARVEKTALAAAMTDVRAAANALTPALGQVGVSMSALPAMAGAARLGLLGLAAAAGGAVAVAMAKASDEADRARERLEGLAGTKLGDQYANSLKTLSGELGISRTAALPAYEALAKIVNLNTPPGGVRIIYGGEPELLSATARSADTLKASIEAVFQQLRLGGAETPEATKAVNKFFQDLAKNGEVTGGMLRDLQQVAPRAASALANAFTGGAQNADQFAKTLDKAPRSIQELLSILPQLAAGSREAFRQLEQNPRTVIGAVEGLKNSFIDLWEVIDGGGKDRPGLVAQGITAIGDAIKFITPLIEEEKRAFIEGRDTILEFLATLGRLPGDAIGYITQFATETVTKIGEWGSAFSEGVSEVMSAIGGIIQSGVNSALAALDGLVSGAVNAAKAAAAAIAGIAKGGGGNASGLSGGGNPGNTDALGNVMGGTGGADTGGDLYPSGGTSSSDYGGVSDYLSDLPQFATGGSLVVGGDGGTDTTLVQFKATRGEVVEVKTPLDVAAQSTSGGIQGLTTIQGKPAGVMSATPEPAALATVKEITDAIDNSTINITKKVLEGSNNIVDALKQLIGGVASSTINPSTGLPVASSSATALDKTAFGTRATGGGGFSTRPSQGAEGSLNTSRPNTEQPLDARSFYGNPAYGYPGGAFGRGQSILGATAQRAARERNRSSSGTGVSDAVARSDHRELMRRTIAGVNAGLFNDVSDGAYNYIDAMASDVSDGGYNYIDAGAWDGSATVGSPTTSAFNSYGGYDGSGWYDTGGDFGVGGSNAWTSANDYMSGGGSNYTSGGWGNGTAAMDYGGGGVDFGYFAKGGRFVAGSGLSGIDRGTDTIHGMIHLTPGETVEITPAGVSTPDSVAMPALNSPVAPDTQSVSNVTSTMTKNVTINVAAGIQAESFIKSRAQIARGL